MKPKAGKIALIAVAAFAGTAILSGVFQGISEHINGTAGEVEPARSVETVLTEDAENEPVLYTLSESVPETEPVAEPEQTEPEAEPEQSAPEVLTLSEPEEPAAPVTRETPDPLFAEYEHEQTVEYVLNTSSKKIHKPTCNDVKKIKPENYSTTTDLSAYLENGYTYCGHCW